MAVPLLSEAEPPLLFIHSPYMATLFTSVQNFHSTRMSTNMFHMISAQGSGLVFPGWPDQQARGGVSLVGLLGSLGPPEKPSDPLLAPHAPNATAL